MDAAQLTTTVRTLNGLSRAQLGKLSNIAPSTIGRIERGELEPSWSSMIAILNSGGFDLDALVPRADVSAIAAARSVIGTDSGMLRDDYQIQPWLDRWKRAGLIDGVLALPGQVGQIALLAGNASKLGARAGVRDFAYTNPWQRTANALRNAGIRYAVTGIPAAEGGNSDYGSDSPVIYVDSPRAAAQTLELEPAADGQRRLTLVPFDRVSTVGVWDDEQGFSWVDSVQGLVDAYASAGRSADRADAVVPQFERRVMIERLSALNRLTVART
ncbi:helix-turn-helix domain-containing protein [Planctomonas psychrotolerans]|uniref:helix-turn-helix domain-containing protein n=1 Tax=Planctomonas psychrotolerans TaxID=2528712 RepID=UPI00123A0561|nr:helix-turn-helix transcriptional regulator [Planctomonas psychrotolerans]